MTKKQIAQLKAGRPGTKVLVHGNVRTIGESSVEIQFSGYSIWIPVKDIVIPRLKLSW